MSDRGDAQRAHTLRHDALREHLLEAGLSVIADHGYEGSSVPLVCAAAGVTPALFRELFGDHERFLLWAYISVRTHVRTAVLDALTDTDGRPLRVRADVAIRAVADFVEADTRRAHVLFVARHGASPLIEVERSRERQWWSEYIADQIRAERGDSSPPPGGYEIATAGLVGGMTEVLTTWAFADPRPTKALIHESMHAMLSAILP
ncbi:TetR/AcrR family transcriptional regulator [Williamsia sp. SKLECPSW1]